MKELEEDAELIGYKDFDSDFSVKRFVRRVGAETVDFLSSGLISSDSIMYQQLETKQTGN